MEKNLECEEEEKNESQQGAREGIWRFDIAGYPLVPVRVTNRYQRSSPGPTTRLNFGRRPFVPVPNTNRYERSSPTGHALLAVQMTPLVPVRKGTGTNGLDG